MKIENSNAFEDAQILAQSACRHTGDLRDDSWTAAMQCLAAAYGLTPTEGA